MRRKGTTLLAALLAAVLLCACGSRPTQQPNRPETPEEVPYAFTLDYHRCAPLVEQKIGSDLVAAARLVIDAFLAGETTVTLPEGDYGVNPGNDLGYALNSMCPAFGAVTDYDDNHFDKAARTVTWFYTKTAEEVREVLDALEQTTIDCMSRLRQGDGETARALLLYHALTEQAAYDYDVFDISDEDLAAYHFRTSGYAALVLHSGICYSYAQALAFLYTQAGLDCAAVTGDGTAGLHMWLMAAVDGKWYYFDPTWDVGGGWYYFGMTAEDRATWAGEFTGGALLGQETGQLADLSDTRFSAVNGHWWTDMTIDRQAGQAVFTEAEGEEVVLPLEEAANTQTDTNLAKKTCGSC